jgi:predicted small lipoprotein YifL
MRQSILLVVLVGMLSACGTKGPLTLPPKSGTPAATPIQPNDTNKAKDPASR